MGEYTEMKINKRRSPLDNLKIVIEEAKRLDINFEEVTTPNIMRYLPAFLDGKTFKEIADMEDVTFKVVLNALCGEKNSALSYLYKAVQNKNTTLKENRKSLVPKPTNKTIKEKNQKNDEDIEQTKSTQKKFTSIQMSLISMLEKHQENNLSIEGLLSENELKILNLFLEGKSYRAIGEEVGLTAQGVSTLLIGRNDSISSKLRSNWYKQSLKTKRKGDGLSDLSEEEILLELKQCNRIILDDALNKLHLTQLKNLCKFVTCWDQEEINLSKEEVILELKQCAREALNGALDHLQLTHLKKLHITVSDWKKVDKKINLSKEEVFLELIQCDRKALNDALERLSTTHLNILFRSVKVSSGE